MYSLLGSRVPFNIPHLKYFAASGNFYTSPNNVLENTSTTFCVKQTEKTNSLLKLGSQTIYAPQFCAQQYFIYH